MFDRTVTLYHVSPVSNMSSIRSRGLLRSGRRRVVWLATPGALERVMRHVVRVHGTNDLVVYRVTVRRSWLYRPGGWVRRGVWCCRCDVPAARVRPVVYLLPPVSEGVAGE